MESMELERPDTLQKQIFRILVDRIHKGEYSPGILLPSENQLVSEFNVSKATIRGALTALEAKGLISRRKGVGSFVQETSIINPIAEFVDFQALIESNGFTPGVQVLQSYIQNVCCELAQDLKLTYGASILKTESIFTADGSPAIFCVNAIPMWVLGEALAEQVLSVPEITEPVCDFMAEKCNQRIDTHRASLWADTIQNFEMDIPDFNPSTPILIVNSIGYNKDKRPIFQSLSAYPDKRMKFTLQRL